MKVVVDPKVPTSKLVEFLTALEDQKKREREQDEKRPRLELPVPEPKEDPNDADGS